MALFVLKYTIMMFMGGLEQYFMSVSYDTKDVNNFFDEF